MKFENLICDRDENGESRRAFCAGALFALLLAGAWSGAARAHDALTTPVYVRLAGTGVGAPNENTLLLELRNNTATALTLTELLAPGGRRLAIERRREIFGQVAWQPVPFLRLDPGEAVTLAPPAYRLRATPETYAQLSEPGGGVRARFSPLLLLVALYEPPGGLLGPDGASGASSPPAPEPGAPQTSE